MRSFLLVIPAQAGIQSSRLGFRLSEKLDSSFRWNDGPLRDISTAPSSQRKLGSSR
jgi:hypothetical protein